MGHIDGSSPNALVQTYQLRAHLHPQLGVQEVKEMLGHEYVLYGNIGGADCTMRTSLNAVGRGDAFTTPYSKSLRT